YKTRDAKPLSSSKIARVLGLDRHTVSRTVTRLEENGLYVDNPLSVKPEWFPQPHRDGTPRCYRHYLVDNGLTELENTLVTVHSPAWPSNCGAGRPDRCATIARYRQSSTGRFCNRRVWTTVTLRSTNRHP